MQPLDLFTESAHLPYKRIPQEKSSLSMGEAPTKHFRFAQQINRLPKQGSSVSIKKGLTWESKVANVSEAALCRFWSRSNEWEIRRWSTATRAMFIELSASFHFSRAEEQEDGQKERPGLRKEEERETSGISGSNSSRIRSWMKESSGEENEAQRSWLGSFRLDCFWCRVTVDFTKDRAGFLSRYRLTC